MKQGASIGWYMRGEGEVSDRMCFSHLNALYKKDASI